MEWKTATVATAAALTAAQILLEFSDDSSEDDELLYYLETHNSLQTKKLITKQKEESMIFRMSDETFQSQYRMRRDTFEFLMQLLGSSLKRQSVHCGRNPMSVERQLLLGISVMVTPESYSAVCKRFNLGKGTMWRIFWNVVKAIYKCLPDYIKWPTREEAKKTADFVFRKYGFPNVLGAIDTTHIKIIVPKVNPDTYKNPNGYYSVNMQIVCDHKMKIIHTHCSEGGSVSDARVFQSSKLQNYCTSKYFLNNRHLLADNAYVIQPCVMVPYEDKLNEESTLYNNVHSNSRRMVTQTIALLKGRFRSLINKLLFKRADLIPQYVSACCVLHNICISRDDLIDIPVLLNDEMSYVDTADVDINYALKLAGLQKREQLKRVISENQKTNK